MGRSASLDESRSLLSEVHAVRSSSDQDGCLAPHGLEHWQAAPAHENTTL